MLKQSAASVLGRGRYLDRRRTRDLSKLSLAFRLLIWPQFKDIHVNVDEAMLHHKIKDESETSCGGWTILDKRARGRSIKWTSDQRRLRVEAEIRFHPLDLTAIDILTEYVHVCVYVFLHPRRF